ncbi:MAG: hypothetical protein COZ18_10580 [Flexibacter sp. CG_4_10_14_3_um_filter_32_15]|nr:MAG: hypothetical protein COZ18_10580 [Flexibacter sp. CG_4_10_14_3_um_filter_32_15]
MNYTTPTNEDKKLERKQQDLDSNLSFQDTKLDSFSDLPNESPIAFDKSSILPLEELEVNYEWVSSTDEFNQNNTQLNASEDIDTESDYLDESFALPKKSSLSNMKSKSNLLLGIILSLVGALGAAYTWGKTTMLIDEYIEQHHYAFMAVLVGLLAALGMRFGGRGHRPIFGVMAILITILGFFVGNALAAVEPIVQSFQLSYLETFTTFDISHLWGFLKDRFEYVDIAFYALGVFFAYYFSFTKPKRLFR